MWIPHLKISLKTFFDNIKGKGKSKGNSTVNSQYTLQNTAIELIRLKCGLSNSCSNPEWFLSCECVLNHNLIRYHISTLQMAVLLLLIIPGFTSSHWKDNKLMSEKKNVWAEHYGLEFQDICIPVWTAFLFCQSEMYFRIVLLHS